MQYVRLFYRDEQWIDGLGEQEHAEIEAEFGQVLGELVESGGFVAAAPLQPTETATTLRVREEETVVTDGPFAETKEQLGGFALIEVDSLAEARAWAAKVPAARYGSVEVRPIMPLQAEATVA